MTTPATQQTETQSTEVPQEPVAELDSQETPANTAPESTPEPATDADTETDDFEAIANKFDEAYKASTSTEEEAPEASQDDSLAATPEPESASQPAPNPVAPTDPRIDTMFEKFEQDLIQENNRDLDAAVSTLKEVNPSLAALSDRHVRGILEIEARDDPRILNAFRNRSLDPKMWNDMVKAKGKQMKLAALPDEQATNGMNAVRASVNDQSATTSEGEYSKEEIANMDDSKFRSLMSQGKL